MPKPIDVVMLRMMVVDDLIRTRFAGKKKDFADAVDIDATTVSRWFMKGKGRKNIGEEAARRIEVKLQLQPGSLVMPDRAIAEDTLIHGMAADFESLSDEERGILKMFRGLKGVARVKATTYLEALSDVARPETNIPTEAGHAKKRGVS